MKDFLIPIKGHLIALSVDETQWPRESIALAKRSIFSSYHPSQGRIIDQRNNNTD